MENYDFSYEEFKNIFEQGYSRREMAEYFKITESRVRGLWKKLGLTRGYKKTERHKMKHSLLMKEKYAKEEICISPKDVAKLAVFFASEDSITGEIRVIKK